ncbi:MAG: winged helix-turn-helix transcriptional regulator [Acidobacteria bacterium]|nr:winged helix-turn-helix transcriptional regulator [Acidobacteriota bacterium]
MSHGKASKREVSGLEAHAGYWLRYVSNHVSQAFARKLEASGVTVAEWVVMRRMYGREELTPGAVAAETGLTRGAVSKLVDRLVGKELVERAGREDDRRYQNIGLTAAGRRLTPALAALADRNEEECFSCLTKAERAALVAAMRKMVERHGWTRVPVE